MPDAGLPTPSIRVVPAGPGAVLLELDAEPSPQLARRLGAWRDALEEQGMRGVYDAIPAYRSMLIEHQPGLKAERVAAWAHEHLPAETPPDAASHHQVPVAYGRQADREDLEARLGIPFEELARRHADAEYTVAFLGFTAGFPYLLGLPSDLQTPRRERPRERTPAGAVAIAGAQAGLYPSASPGGWWVLGLTDAVLFDPRRDPPALFSPGDSVRFTAVDGLAAERPANGNTGDAANNDASGETDVATERTSDTDSRQAVQGVRIIEAWPRSVSVQAGPRRGVAHLGLAESGALDPRACAEANEIVGNPRATAALEAIGNPVGLVTQTRVRAALAGGGLGAHLDGRPLRRWAAFDWPANSVLELAPDRSASGYTTYLAVAGGFAAETFRGSTSTDARAGVGGVRGYLGAGDELALAKRPATDAGSPHPGTPRYPERIVLRVHPGPQHQPHAWSRLLGSSFRVAVLDRTGARLQGPRVHLDAHEILSEGSPAGSVQVPPNGQPIVLLADRGRTGGYAKPAIVDPRDLWRLAQARPGTEIWFAEPDARRSAIKPVHWNP